MKVMCIAEKSGWRFKYPRNIIKSFLWGFYKSETLDYSATGPSYGETCTVTQIQEIDKEIFYSLKEYPVGTDGKPCNFDSRNFVPLSEISETEFEREYQKEKL